jgi:hypothetical protein
VSFIGAGGWIEFSQTTQCDIPEDGHLHTPLPWEPEISFVCFLVSCNLPLSFFQAIISVTDTHLKPLVPAKNTIDAYVVGIHWRWTLY